MGKPRYVTVMLIPDGTEGRRGYRVRRWMLRAGVIGLGVLVLGIVLFFVFYGSVLERAAITERLEAENERLVRYQYKVKLLEQNLMEAREIVGRLAELAGIDYEFPAVPDDSTFFASLETPPVATSLQPPREDFSLPSGLPMRGFVSQDFETEDPDRFHPGIDIAASTGTPVLATAAGVVEATLYDSVYGHVVILRHNDSVTTVYGHNSKILVDSGQQVMAGGRVALSGNSGKSTAPHLHYEVRVFDKPIDPLESPYDEKQRH